MRLAGHVHEDALIDLYRRAWVLVSASAREGWGMTITEAAACGTPAVVTRPAPRLGEHTREVLRAASSADDEIEALFAAGVVA